VTEVKARANVSRRRFLATTGATAIATVILPSGVMLMDAGGAWAVTVEALKPETMTTLILMARDIYPHDRLEDAWYAKAVSGYDAAAKDDAATKQVIEEGVVMLDEKAKTIGGARYVEIEQESVRVEVLKATQDGELFRKMRGDLITGLYNQHDIWAKFGYEGSSADKGGYLHRGFDDIDWLKA
jgi:hypothetical protein